MSTDHDNTPETPDFLDGVDLKFSHIQVISEQELHALIGPGLLDTLMGLLDRYDPEPYLPRRGTADYRQMLEGGADTTDLHALTGGIGTLWNGYGWPAMVDFMGVLIDRIVTYAPDAVRDRRDVPRLNRIIKTGQDEADLMETAVHVANEPGAKEAGYDFLAALELGKQLVGYVDQWIPIYQQAIEAGCRDEMTRPHLVRLPGLREGTDRDQVVQGVLVLALAAMACTNPVATLANMVDDGARTGELDPRTQRAIGRYRHK